MNVTQYDIKLINPATYSLLYRPYLLTKYNHLSIRYDMGLCSVQSVPFSRLNGFVVILWLEMDCSHCVRFSLLLEQN